jgi:hypothetical protein
MKLSGMDTTDNPPPVVGIPVDFLRRFLAALA